MDDEEESWKLVAVASVDVDDADELSQEQVSLL
jgi:hypothetical protein